jgi:hypothetical protein
MTVPAGRALIEGRLIEEGKDAEATTFLNIFGAIRGTGMASVHRTWQKPSLPANCRALQMQA